MTLAADFELWARFYQHAELYGVQALLGGFRLRTNQNTDRYAKQYREQCYEVLKRYGGRTYGRTESWLRRNLGRRADAAVETNAGSGVVGRTVSGESVDAYRERRELDINH